MIPRLEFPYGLKGRHAIALELAFAGLTAFALWLSGDSPAQFLDTVLSVRYGYLVMLVPVAAFWIPFEWLRTRGKVLRLTDSELRVGKVVLPVNELDSIQFINQGPTRMMIVRAGKRKAAIKQMYLPSPKAFDEILPALTSIHSVSRTSERVAQKRPSAASVSTNQPAIPERVSVSELGLLGRNSACEAIRQKLRLAVMYDEAKIDRLVNAEREAQPGASEEQLLAAAYERWCRDNRT